MTTGSKLVYVYGVLRARDAKSLGATGVNDSTVRVVSHENLAALVSDLEGRELSAAREVRAHWGVLQEISETTTVLPVRFGTVMEGERALRDELLAPNAERLGSLLESLAGRVQLSVKGAYDEEALLREIVRGSPAVARLRARVRRLPDAASYYERIQLGELVAAEVDAFRAADSHEALARLEPEAVAADVGEVSGPTAAFNLSFLVDRERVDGFGARVRELADFFGDRVTIRFVGPLPPYSFAGEELDSRTATWA